jgi:plastocyanin
MRKGEADEVRFDTPGTYEYICSIHPNMKGTVVVE